MLVEKVMLKKRTETMPTTAVIFDIETLMMHLFYFYFFFIHENVHFLSCNKKREIFSPIQK
jgi:hypothetical protein